VFAYSLRPIELVANVESIPILTTEGCHNTGLTKEVTVVTTESCLTGPESGNSIGL
jgi:hypothetical protein